MSLFLLKLPFTSSPYLLIAFAFQSLSKCCSILLLIFVFTICGCKKPEEPTRNKFSVQRQNYNVLLITLDTVRADALQIYSPDGAAVPHLQELAKRSVVFRNAHSQIPYTLPSHTSMFTGRYPISHGVIDNVRGLLPVDLPTLAESFRNRGYQTAGFLGSLILSRPTKINRGFDYYDDYFNKAALIGSGIDRVERRAEEVLYSFQHWFGQRDPGKPFFAFLHFYDAHAPYEPPPHFAPASGAGLRARYLGEIRYIDFVLGKLFQFLSQQKGGLNNTVILIESDHGEMFKEHQEMGHGYFIYEPVVHVPLILYIPSLQIESTVSIPEVVELVDITPTLLDLARIPMLPNMQGKSLIPVVEGEREDDPSFSETYLAALEIGVSPLLSIRNQRYKYIETAIPELYDLKNDPQEETNLWGKEKSVGSEMKRQLSEHKQKYSSDSRNNRTVSTEEAEQFAALGYLGGDVPEEQWDLSKDAKQYIDGWNQVIAIRLLIQKKEYRQALALIEKTKRLLPAKMEALQIHEADCYSALHDYKKSEEILLTIHEGTLFPLAQIYLKTGRQEKAVELYRTELNKKFELHKLYNFVFLLKMSNRNAEALQLVRELQKSSHDPDEARPYLAEMFYVLEQWDDMEKYGLELVDLRPWELKWYLLLCDAYEEQKNYRKALALMQRGEDRFLNHPAYLQRLANLFVETNRPELASKILQRIEQMNLKGQ